MEIVIHSRKKSTIAEDSLLVACVSPLPYTIYDIREIALQGFKVFSYDIPYTKYDIREIAC